MSKPPFEDLPMHLLNPTPSEPVIEDGVSVPDSFAKKAKFLQDLQPAQNEDGKELLRHRFLCRGAGMLLCGPTGIGKSSFSMQAAIQWALGLPHFEIEPARPLRSLIIQAENDEGDLYEMLHGVMAGLRLTADERKIVGGMIQVVTEKNATGDKFCLMLDAGLNEIQPDLVWIDPAFSYMGGNASAQAEVSAFLRNRLNPIIDRNNCGLILVHHTNKPPSGKEKNTWQAGDFAYLGSGSAEWANWARAVVNIRGIGSHDVFELQAAKRGGHLRWKDSADKRVFAKHIAHSKIPGEICWVQAEESDMPSGRPPTHDPLEMLELLPPEGSAAGDWETLAKNECGIPHTSFHRIRKALSKDGKINKCPNTGKWQPNKKS